MRTITLLVATAVYLLSPAWAYERPDAVSLAGEWDLCLVEPMLDVVADRAAKPDFPQLSPSWDKVIDSDALPPWDGEWQPVTVPAAWEHVAGIDYNGAGWYARYVDVPPEWCGKGWRIWLEFDAVATAAGVWVNDHFVGAHVGDYSRWRVELTDVVAQAVEAPRVFAEEIPGATEGLSVINPYTLLVAVYVDELPGHITQGFLNMIAPHHGGIWQDVRLYATGPVAIEPDGICVETDYDGGIARVTIELDTPIQIGSNEQSLSIVFLTPDGRAFGNSLILVGDPDVESNSKANSITFNYSFDEIFSWTPENPNLYTALVNTYTSFPWSRANRNSLNEAIARGEATQDNDYKFSSDTAYCSFAFRDVRIDGSQVMLNGEPIQIRSALNWGYYPGVISPAPTPEQVREEFAYIKSLGFNAETVCLVNMPDYFYDIADEMGMLIWQEYPTWHNDFTAQHEETLQREFKSYFRRDRHHQSIFLRSISVEAGVDDQQVMAGLCSLAREMTDTPVQDNSSWFWLSNPELADWYGEDNYLNCNQWARHMLVTLPAKLDGLPEKPYIIGESILSNTWPDCGALASELLANGTSGGKYADALRRQSDGMPYWFPKPWARCFEIEAELRAKYNSLLPAGEDIVSNYLLPQSYAHTLAFRRFQIMLMNADPRYAGYTVNVVRDIAQLRAGLMDDLGRGRWTPAEWDWHGAGTGSAITVAGTRDLAGSAADVADGQQQSTDERWRKQTQPLMAWKGVWDNEIVRDTPLYYLREGYSDLSPLLTDLPEAQAVTADDIETFSADTLPNRGVVLTKVLTHGLVDYIAQGGVALLLTSKWPGALGSHHHFFWRDAMLVPPLGPWDVDKTNRVVQLQPFDLTFGKTDVIPVDELGITDYVDPLLRLYDTHDLSTVITYDQVFAARAGQGMLIASSLDHSTDGGQWVLGELASWAHTWAQSYGADISMQQVTSSVYESSPAEMQLLGSRAFPIAELPIDRLHELAVVRANAIIPLNDGWRFQLDPDWQGEDNGWMTPGFDDSTWDIVQCGRSWEAQGFSYDGMGWYRRELLVPTDWSEGKITLVAEGVDDAYTVWVNGVAVATHGSFTVHEETVWQMQTTTDLTEYLKPGESNLLVLQVVDITGQGGIYKPLYLAVE